MIDTEGLPHGYSFSLKVDQAMQKQRLPPALPAPFSGYMGWFFSLGLLPVPL